MAISALVAKGAVANVLGSAGTENVQGETQKNLDVISNDLLIKATEWSGLLAALVSEEMDEPYQIPDVYPKGRLLLLFDPLDGSSNIDVNVSIGTIFSILEYESIYVIGLGISQFLDHAMAALKMFLPERINLITAVGMTLSLLFSLLFALFGYLGNKKNKAAVIIGLLLYFVDMGITVWLESYESTFFHLIGLVVIGWNLFLLSKEK